MDFLNTLHFFQCRPHRGCTAASRHASDFQGDGCFLCRQRRRNCSHQEQHAHGSNDRSRVHIRYLRRRLYRAPAFARAAFWDDVLGTSKKPKSAKTLADGLTVPTDLVGSPAPFRSVVSVLWLCGSGGCFAVEPRTDQRSDDDLYQAYRKADGQNMSREKMECNRHDRSQQIPKAPDGCTGTERRFCPGAVARAYRSIEPDGEDAHQKTPGQEHQKCAAAHLPAQRPHCCIHILGQYEAVQSEFKHIDDHPGDESPEDHPVPVDLSHGLLLRMEIWLIVPPGVGWGKRRASLCESTPAPLAVRGSCRSAG